MIRIKFKDSEHQEAYFKFVKMDNTSVNDMERRAVLYLLATFSETRRLINDIYDFESHGIKPDGLSKDWQTGGTRRVTMLAFNLFNGWRGDGKYNFSPKNLFFVDTEHQLCMLEAIKIAYSINKEL